MVKYMMAGAGNTEDESVIACCAKCKKYSKYDGDVLNELRSQPEGFLIDQFCNYYHI